MSDVICPICKSKAKPLDETGDAEGFDCPKHQSFKVAESVFAVTRTKDASLEQWESALARAKQRRTDPGEEWPVIQTYDFEGFHPRHGNS
jgi:hypothetical protein